jgi:hypothetical protein
MITHEEQLRREAAKNAAAEAIKSGDLVAARHHYNVMLELKAKADCEGPKS